MNSIRDYLSFTPPRADTLGSDREDEAAIAILLAPRGAKLLSYLACKTLPSDLHRLGISIKCFCHFAHLLKSI